MTGPGALTLTGFCDSVYCWSVRWALAELGVAAGYREVDPFDDAGRAALAGLHPFGLVPVLQDGDFTLSETSAILTYLDQTCGGGGWVPEDARGRARMAQVISVTAGQVYWPLVRQVFSNGYYLPRLGLAGDDATLGVGLARAPGVLAALEAVADEGLVLDAQRITVADLMLAPMLSYVNAVPQGAQRLATYPALTRWHIAMAARPQMQATRPPCLTGGCP